MSSECSRNMTAPAVRGSVQCGRLGYNEGMGQCRSMMSGMSMNIEESEYTVTKLL